jgi:hypothetical protein
VAQRTQNVQCDENGNVLFFIVDGNVYNGDGLLIADAGSNVDDRACEVCFFAGNEVHVIPVPGSCTRFYVIGLFFRAYGSATRLRLRWGVLDMRETSDLPVYADHCVSVKGRFLKRNTELDFEGISLLPNGSALWEPLNIEPEQAPAPIDGGYFQDGTIYFSVAEGEQALYASSIQVDQQGRHLLVVRCNKGLVMLQVDGEGIRHLPYAPTVVRWDYNQLPTTTINDTDQSQRGEIALHLEGNTLKVAITSYWGPDPPGLGGVPGHQTRINYWVFQFTAGPVFNITTTIVGPTQPNANPRTYSLDLYPASDPPPLDGAGNPVLRPAVSGLEFSPNGRYIYFVKSPDHAYPNSNGVESNFGYIDTQWQTGDPGTYYTYLPIDLPAATRKLVDTQMGINVSPTGESWPALYMISADEDTYWLSAFHDPDVPLPGNWDPEVLVLPNVCSFSESNSPLTRFRHVNRRPLGATHVTTMTQAFCCDDMVMARDRSSTITAENCDLYWEPGNNDFWNTDQPVYIATELRIATGAHVTAQNMEFRFGEGATLIIEPGASLACTNCIFTNACEGTRWNGIEVRGKVWENQFGGTNPPNQGKLVLRASTVENAVTGVFVGMSVPFGGLAAGGVVQATRSWVTEDDEDGNPVSFWRSTTFRNCRQGVRFLRYQNHLPNGTAFRNLSSFNDCVFTVDDQYPVAYDFMHHVNLHYVDGIHFGACTFQNTLPDDFFDITGDHPGSAYLGHGIYSLDAHYSVGGSCNVPWPDGPISCPDNDMRFSHFIGLDHGIHALQGTSAHKFTASRVRFTNNIAGVFARGVIGYKVVDSKFSVGGRNVELTIFPDEVRWAQSHRGLFSTESYGMIVDDNELELDAAAAPGRLTEGIVIGYNRDHNDMVFRNTARNLDLGYTGEGVCADQVNKPLIGLHFQCNNNQGNKENIRSRLVSDPEALPQHQIIRTNQGRSARVADNSFDQDPAHMDFVNDGWQYNVIAYHWAPPEVPFRPIYISQGVAVTGTSTTGLPNVRPNGNCDNRRLPLIHLRGEVRRDHLVGVINDEKEAYGNNRYLYEQLIDGGNTDEVVQEIMDSWPQDAWDLRAYLLARSPYLSTEVLMAAMDRPTMPAAMKAEVCIANPDATRRDGFMRWLETECLYPLSESLLASIVASWDMRTYRTALESTLAHHHAEMTQAAHLLMDHYITDSTAFPVDSLRAVWEMIRTPAARYAEAMLLMQQGHFTAATAVVQAIPQEHPRLRPGQLTERDRMLGLIAFWEQVAVSGRSDAELDSAEVVQLEALIGGAYDRPATWAQNVLCFHYGRCRTPMTGGDEQAPKSLAQPAVANVVSPVTHTLRVHPNPAVNWAAIDYDLLAEARDAMILVRDVLGRPVEQFTLGGRSSQLVLDTRPLAKGLYTVELLNGGRILQVEKLIVE